MVEIQLKSTDAAKRQLSIQQDEEFARLHQSQEIENRRASQQSDIARVAAERRRETEEAGITANRAIELARIAMGVRATPHPSDLSLPYPNCSRMD